MTSMYEHTNPPGQVIYFNFETLGFMKRVKQFSLPLRDSGSYPIGPIFQSHIKHKKRLMATAIASAIVVIYSKRHFNSLSSIDSSNDMSCLESVPGWKPHIYALQRMDDKNVHISV